MILGSFWGGVCGGLADFIGALLFPFGPYFPGFTATAFLSGAIFGLVGKVARKEKGRVRFLLLAVLLLAIKELICSLVLNSLWISILYGSPFTAVVWSRVPLSAVTLVFEVFLAFVLRESVIPAIKKEI